MIAYTLSFITIVLNKMHHSANNNMLMQPMHAVYGTCATKKKPFTLPTDTCGQQQAWIQCVKAWFETCPQTPWRTCESSSTFGRPCEVKVYLKGPAPKYITKWSMSSSANHKTETTVFPALSTNQKWQNTKKRELQLVSKQKGEGTNIWQSYFWSWNNVLDVLLCCLPRRR